jgi:glycosyltransferase involved in cell wall biosynthesis
VAGRADIAIVSLATTMGLVHADRAFAAQLEAAGATCRIVPVEIGAGAAKLRRTMFLTDTVEAVAARRSARGLDADVVVYSTITAALLQPDRGPYAVRFDGIAATNRPGPGGAWQRRRERGVLERAGLLLASSEAAAVAAGYGDSAVVLPLPVLTAPAPAPDAPVAVAYGADPKKRAVHLLCQAWAAAAPAGARLMIGGIDRERGLRALRKNDVAEPDGVEWLGSVQPDRWRALVAGARVFVNASRFEDWGIAQMEALAAGTPLVTVPSAGPNVALPLARELAPELVASERTAEALAGVLRTGLALDAAARERYAERAAVLLEPYTDESVRRRVAEVVLPRLLSISRS